MERICCIVAAGPSEAYIPEGAFVIAADAGVKKLDELGISADIIMGDFDSLAETPEGDNVIVFPVKKDDTDTLLALKKAMRLGYGTVYISGGLGGKLDHTVANLQTLSFAYDNCINAYLIGDGQTAAVIGDGERLSFKADAMGRISVFAFGGNAEGVCITGLQYEADGISLTPAFPLGVSNGFAGREAEILVNSGRLLVIWDGLPDDLR